MDKTRTIDFIGEECRVYATPAMLNDIELTCRDVLLQHLDAGEDSLGTRVELDHLQPTLMGMWTEITATVSAVDGRAVAFDVIVVDEMELTARCKHNRFIVDKDKTAARLEAKAARSSHA